MQAAPDTLRRRELLQRLEQAQAAKREWLRRMIIDHDRVDLLATRVLGYQVEPFHLQMMQHQFRYPDGNMCWAWRGSGKTTIRTVCHSIHKLVKDPNARILLASKSAGNATTMLQEIKNGFERREFIDLFGDYRGRKWDGEAIVVAPRTSGAKEPSISCVGFGSSVPSRHYDVIHADDLVDDELSRTPLMRSKVQTFFYKTLLPCLEPGGELHVTGNPWHYHDLYAHLRENEMAGERTVVIPAMTGSDTDGWVATWADKFPVEWLLKRRSAMGALDFATQYLCDAERLKGGGVFNIDYFQRIADSQIPPELPKYMGVDLATGLTVKHDRFAIVIVAYDRPTDRYYVIDFFAARKPVWEQRRLAIEYGRRHNIVRGAAESNFYQAAFSQETNKLAPDVSIRPIKTDKNKERRAWKLAAKFEDGKFFFRKGLDPLIEELVLFPTGDFDDGLDALDLGVKAIRLRRKRAPRANEPGVL